VPKTCTAVYDAFMEGHLDEALALQKIASRIPLMGGFGNAAAVVKYGLSLKGICSPKTAEPIALAGGQEEKIKGWLQSVGFAL
jgi:dihydrodipicolinate synthase/N-acetylneuraminate lyase